MHKKNCSRDANNDKQRTTTMGNTFQERYQELEEEIKHEAAAEKNPISNIMKMEVPQRRRKRKQKKKRKRKAVARTEKAVAETDTRETAPHVHQADANTAAAKEKPVTKMQCTFSKKTTK